MSKTMIKNPNILTYKGYKGTIEFDLEDDILHGTVLHISDLVTYEGETLPELKASFEQSIDSYLEQCKTLGRNPNKPFTGNLNIRINPETHKKLAYRAADQGCALNAVIGEILDKACNQPVEKKRISNLWKQFEVRYEKTYPLQDTINQLLITKSFEVAARQFHIEKIATYPKSFQLDESNLRNQPRIGTAETQTRIQNTQTILNSDTRH